MTKTKRDSKVDSKTRMIARGGRDNKQVFWIARDLGERRPAAKESRVWAILI